MCRKNSKKATERKKCESYTHSLIYLEGVDEGEFYAQRWKKQDDVKGHDIKMN
jgi:hypothetical protein